MTLYTDANEWLRVAEMTLEENMFRKSVYNASMAIEMFLKHLAEEHIPDAGVRFGHNHEGLRKLLATKYTSQLDKRVTKRSSKYVMAARYSDRDKLEIYTGDFAREMYSFAGQAKAYVDACLRENHPADGTQATSKNERN